MPSVLPLLINMFKALFLALGGVVGLSGTECEVYNNFLIRCLVECLYSNKTIK